MTQLNPLTLRLRDPQLWRSDGYINGEWSCGAARFEVTDPATGSALGAVSDLGRDEAKAAVHAAHKALPAWSSLSAKQRGSALMKWFELMQSHSDDLSAIMTAEQGKPLAEARAEVQYAASFVEWFAEEGRRAYGEIIPGAQSDKRYLVIRQAVGVCAAITPWNFPLAMITRKVAPALAAGCTVVLKPAEQTPLSALALAWLAHQAGIPPGVFNVVTSSARNAVAVGQAWCEHPLVKHVSFTGSTEVGRILMKQCSTTVKKLALELGGNAPFIVFDDADIDNAVAGAIAAKFRNAGQTCVCVNRFYVHARVHDAFVARLASKVREMKVGNGFDADVTLGPLIDDQAVEKVHAHISDALRKGARLVCGGSEPDGRFMQPTVLADVTEDMLCMQEETFGPVAAVARFDSEDEVIARANATEFGLASYVYTRDIGRVFRVTESLACGMVGVNTGLISATEAPFGGVKQSGLGREGARQGLDEYLDTKYICIGDLSSAS